MKARVEVMESSLGQVSTALNQVLTIVSSLFNSALPNTPQPNATSTTNAALTQHVSFKQVPLQIIPQVTMTAHHSLKLSIIIISLSSPHVVTILLTNYKHSDGPKQFLLYSAPDQLFCPVGRCVILCCAKRW